MIRVRWKSERDNHLRLFFEVADTGIGIAADKLQHVFEKFSQAEESTTRRFGGTGLGLTICGKLVKMMNGHIGVKSELRKGSVFHFDVQLGLDKDPPCSTGYSCYRIERPACLGNG